MHMGDGWRGPLDKIDAFRYEIPRSYKPAMRTNGVIFIDESMVAQLRQDQAPEQVANVATMPGIIGNAMAMPDIHWGYGFPIGRSEEHTSELQSRPHLVCRLLLEKKNTSD